MVFLFLPTRKIVPNLTWCGTPLDVSFLVCLFVWVVASHMHWPSLVGVSTLVNYNERHVDKVIWEGGGLFSFQRPAQVQDVAGHAPEDQKQRGRGGMIVSFLPLKMGVFLEGKALGTRLGAYFMLFDGGSWKRTYGIMFETRFLFVIPYWCTNVLTVVIINRLSPTQMMIFIDKPTSTFPALFCYVRLGNT